MYVTPEERDACISRERVLPKWAKLLLMAAALIEEHGHCKHALYRDGAFCIGGAISFAAGWNPNEQIISRNPPGADIAMLHMHKALNGNFLRWNNSSKRSKEEVVAKLRAVALGG